MAHKSAIVGFTLISLKSYRRHSNVYVTVKAHKPSSWEAKEEKTRKVKATISSKTKKGKKINIPLISWRKTDCWWYRLGTRTLLVNCWRLNYGSGANEKSYCLLKQFQLVQRMVQTTKLGRTERAIWIGDLGVRCALFLIWLVTEMISLYHNWAFSKKADSRVPNFVTACK